MLRIYLEYNSPLTHDRAELKGGDKYTVEFLIDQRKCDMLSVLGAALNSFEQNKEASGFKILNFTAYQRDNVTTIQLEFEENVGDKKKRKLLQKEYILPLYFR